MLPKFGIQTVTVYNQRLSSSLPASLLNESFPLQISVLNNVKHIEPAGLALTGDFSRHFSGLS